MMMSKFGLMPLGAQRNRASWNKTCDRMHWLIHISRAVDGWDWKLCAYNGHGIYAWNESRRCCVPDHDGTRSTGSMQWLISMPRLASMPIMRRLHFTAAGVKGGVLVYLVTSLPLSCCNGWLSWLLFILAPVCSNRLCQENVAKANVE